MTKQSIFFPLYILPFVFAVLQSNAQQWNDIGTFNQIIYDIKEHKDLLFIGGNFDERDGNPARIMTQFDGTSFTDETKRRGGSGIEEFVEFNDELYNIGGMSYLTQGHIGLSKWENNDWVAQGNYSFNQQGVHVEDNTMYLGFSDGKIKRIDTNWNETDLPAIQGRSPGIYDFAIYKSELYAGGAFDTVIGQKVTSLVKYDGSKWVDVNNAFGTKASNRASVSALAVYKGELYVGGGFEEVGGKEINAIARWNGTRWDSVGAKLTLAGFEDPYVFSLKVFGDTLWVAGRFETAGGLVSKNVAKWDGTTWHAAGIASATDAVICMEYYKEHVYAGTNSFTTSKLYGKKVGKLVAPASIGEDAVNELSVYPNPSKGMVVLSNFNTSDRIVFELTNIEGKVVYEREIFEQERSVELDLSGDIQKGMYFYKTISAKGVSYSGKLLLID